MTATSSQTSAWIRRFRPEPAATSRLICLPHAGGSATFYLPVARGMPDGVEVLAIQYPGRQDRRGEPLIQDIATFADRVTEELEGWLDRPFALFGHSMGATIAFEVALRLRERGIVPLHLFASGRRAPSRHRDESVHLRDDAGLIAEMKQLSGTDPQVFEDEEILQMVLPSFRSDYRAAETYRYRSAPALDCPIVAFTGDDDPHVTIDEARAWGQHTASSFSLKIFPGGHFYLNTHAAAVMREISGHLPAA